MKKTNAFRALILLITLATSFLGMPPLAHAAPAPGSLIKRADHPAVYYYATNGRRYVFPNERVFRTWYVDFSTVQTVTAAEMTEARIGGNVTYRPGFRMVKIDTDPKVYAISRGGVLRHIASETVAAAIFGSGWATLVDDIPDAFFVNYAMGSQIVSVSDYDRSAELASATTINADKNLGSLTPSAPLPEVPTGTTPVPTPTPSCTADTWTCADWNMCSTSGTQTRSCTMTTDSAGVTTPSPATTQSCTPTASTPSCTADVWSCTGWNTCSASGSQSRVCIITNECAGVSTPSPAATQTCTPPTTTTPPTSTTGQMPTVPSGYELVDLITDTGFETTVGGFAPNGSADGTVSRITANAIQGASSLRVVANSYGRIAFEKAYPYNNGPIANSLTVKAKMRVDSAGTAGLRMQVCAIAYLMTSSEPTSTCQDYPVSTQVTDVYLNLNTNAQRLDRVYFQFKLDDGGTITATIDDAHLYTVVQGSGSTTPTQSCTADTWSCTDWVMCSTSGSQARSCQMTTDCAGVTTPSPATTQSCTAPSTSPTCTADTWTCTAWNACSTSGSQTRSCSMTTDCAGVVTPSPATSQSCTPTTTPSSCTADTWNCGAWSACSTSGSQTRTCSMTNDCSTVVTPSPATTQSCTPPTTSSVYPGYTYNLPTSRPYISLQNFSQSSPNYTSFKSWVDAAVAGSPGYDYAPSDAVVMYAITNQASYINHAIARVDAIVAQAEADIAAGRNPEIAGDSYLEFGWYMEQIALTYDRGYSLLTPAQRTRWAAFADRALTNLWNPGQAQWGGRSATWTGWSTDNPGNNYHFSFLEGTQLWALASQNMTWINFLQQNKFPPLANYFARLSGGGSREGTGYGTAQKNLFENYIMWKASTGEDLSRLSTHAKDTIDYWVHATVPTLDRFAPIGDQSRVSQPEIYDYHENLVREAVVLNPGTEQARRGVWWLNNNSDSSLDGFNRRIGLLTTSDVATPPTALEYHATGVGHFFARNSWNRDATWLSFVAGPYDESHAHHDQGSFTFYRNGWLAATSNMWSHSGIQQTVGAHNVLRFSRNGATIEQNESVSSMTYSKSGDVVTVQANLTPAYSRRDIDVRSWTRELRYQGNTLRVTDVCQVGTGVSTVFQVQVPTQPTVQSDGSIRAGNLSIRGQAGYTVNLVNMRNVDSDFNSGWRVELSNPAGCAFTVDLTAL